MFFDKTISLSLACLPHGQAAGCAMPFSGNSAGSFAYYACSISKSHSVSLCIFFTLAKSRYVWQP